jgi:hypothetical protein
MKIVCTFSHSIEKESLTSPGLQDAKYQPHNVICAVNTSIERKLEMVSISAVEITI